MKGKINPAPGKGLYTLNEASLLTGVTWARVRHWIRGDLRNPNGERSPVPPIVETEFKKEKGIYLLSFLDLIEIRVIDKFREKGVSIYAIRQAHERAKDLFKITHPFAAKRFLTDGRDILTYIMDETHDKALLNLRRSQFEIPEITDMFLNEIELSSEGISLRWWPMNLRHSVVIDPERSFGQPIVAVEGVPTIVLAQAVLTEKSIEKASDWYCVTSSAVEDAYRYETEFIRRLAA